MSYIVRVDVDGSVTEVDGRNLLAAARAELGEVDTFSLRPINGAPPEMPQIIDGDLVGVCGSTSRLGDPVVNVKTWALYGRSPICGPTFLAFDSDDIDNGTVRRELPAEFVDRMRTDWATAPLLNVTVMRHIAAEQGCRWPT